MMVTPMLLGDGKRLFEIGRPKFALSLIEARPLDTGAVILHYRRDRAREEKADGNRRSTPIRSRPTARRC